MAAHFADLNLPWNDRVQACNTVRMAMKNGFQAVALNNFVEHLSVKTGKKDKDKSPPIKTPDEIKIPEEELNLVNNDRQVGQRPVRQYTRFSTILSDSLQVIRLQKDDVIQSHDLISVQPTTEKLFLAACKDLEVDIISLDFTQRLPFNPKRTAVGCAIERGVHFEILYAPMIRDQAARVHTLAEGSKFVSICRGKNIIVSSGCQKMQELRDPYSIANLIRLFGLSEAEAKRAITSNCRSVLMHAAARKSSKAYINIVSKSTLTPANSWTVPPAPCDLESSDAAMLATHDSSDTAMSATHDDSNKPTEITEIVVGRSKKNRRRNDSVDPQRRRKKRRKN